MIHKSRTIVSTSCIFCFQELDNLKISDTQLEPSAPSLPHAAQNVEHCEQHTPYAAQNFEHSEQHTPYAAQHFEHCEQQTPYAAQHFEHHSEQAEASSSLAPSAPCFDEEASVRSEVVADGAWMARTTNEIGHQEGEPYVEEGEGQYRVPVLTLIMSSLCDAR
jgi:hypothetical protein